MAQEQYPVMLASTRRNTISRVISFRVLQSIFMGVGITLLLTGIEIAILWLFNPYHLLGADTAPRLPALETLPLHVSGLLLIPLVELAGAFLLALVTARPRALLAYLRDVQKAQERYSRLYTPLTALTNIYETPVAYYQDTTDPSNANSGQNVSILDLVQQPDAHQLILGVPGAGKTMALRVYQYTASQRRSVLVLRRDRIPVYIPMKNYSLFLKTHLQTGGQRPASAEAGQQVTLLDFLRESDLPGMHHLRHYLEKLMAQGRLLLLCDGLNEVDSNYLTAVCTELVLLMLETQNRLVMTCREVDYREQRDLVTLVNDGNVARAVIYPLQPEQVREFVERYVEEQGGQWQHTAGQIMQVIDRSRLRYHCNNPMMLFTLMEIIDKIGVERGKQIDTRGRLLREFVRQLIEHERQQPKWSREAPAESDVIRFLSEVACAARWSNDRNAIQLHVSTESVGTRFTAPLPHRYVGFARHTLPSPSLEELADELQVWLDEHSAREPFAVDGGVEPRSIYEPYNDLGQLLQFAQSAALIDISPNGVLSFRHELIAEYFVAEYFFAADSRRRSSPLPIREELLENVGRWSEPVAIWAGLLDNPMALAERFGMLGRNKPGYVLQALALSLVCIGVVWTPPQAETQRSVVLPSSVAEALSVAVRNRAAREDLARIFTRCAEEGGQEVYRSLLPLLMVEGVDELLILLDATIVPELLFTHLNDAIDNIAYEAQVKRLVRVLGRFGGVAVTRAAELSRPAAGRSIRLRAAAINILGGTNDQRAVEPLMARLSDTEPFIVERAVNALIRLGPELTLTRVLSELENRAGAINRAPTTRQIHRAALVVLGRFLDVGARFIAPIARHTLTAMQHQRILETVVPVLTSNYITEPEVQQLAREMLVRQGRSVGRDKSYMGAASADATVTGAAGRDKSGPYSTDGRWEKVIESLLWYLSSRDEVAGRNVVQTLQEIGEAATPRLLEQLNSQASEIVRVRVVEVLRVVHDPRALPHLLRLVADPVPAVQQQVAGALHAYVPESIPGLIELVLSNASESVADRAAQILGSIGEKVVGPVTQSLGAINRGAAINRAPTVPGRTRLLVQVLARVHDPEAIPALITLLKTPEIESLLAVIVVRVLGQFADTRVVPPLLDVLANPNAQLYEEAIDALSHLGDIAFGSLIAALDVKQETATIARVRRALLGMVPFPGEQLIAALGQSSDARAEQIMIVFKSQGADAAQVLVKHLFDKDERVRGYVRYTLGEMPGPVVVPALLEVLNRPTWRSVIAEYLLDYPEAISPLVNLLGDYERGEAATAILPQFGPDVLLPLVSGLDDQRSMAREHAQRIIVTLVRQRPEVVRDVVNLFSISLPPRAREVLLDVLTNELADVSVPMLLEGLEDAHLIDDAAEALVRLLHRSDGRDKSGPYSGLLNALRVEERRRGAEIALIRAEGLAVAGVGELITDPDPKVAQAAQDILREIGVPAFSFIWAAHSDTSNRARREAALNVFRGMRTEVIKDELVALLTSDRPEDIGLALALLLERIHDENALPHASHEMIPALLEHVQTHGGEHTSLRIIALLLLLGGSAVIDHLIQVLYTYPTHQDLLVYAFLLLGGEGEEALLEVLHDPNTPSRLYAEVIGILGMLAPYQEVSERAQTLSTYGLSSNRTSILQPDQLTISLRALGGLLAGGHWDISQLQELRRMASEGTAERELYEVLLGRRYGPQIARLEDELQEQQEELKRQIAVFTARIMSDQERFERLASELEQVRHEHSVRGDALEQKKQENQELTQQKQALTREKQVFEREKQTLAQANQRLAQEKQTLQARVAQFQAYNIQLTNELNRWRNSQGS